MPRPATSAQKAIIREWLNAQLNRLQQGDATVVNKIYQAIMTTDAELLAAVNAHTADFVAEYQAEIDNLNTRISLLQTRIDELSGGA